MGTTTEQIEGHIEVTRDALGTNLEELQRKVKDATDWRHHFRTHPKMLLGVALGGGVLLATLLGGRNNRGAKSQAKPSASAARPAKSAHQGGARPWDKVKGAIVAAASARLLSYTAQAFPGIRKQSEHNEKAGGIFSPTER